MAVSAVGPYSDPAGDEAGKLPAALTEFAVALVDTR